MDERGGVSLIVVTGVLTFCLMALGAADLGALLSARARAQAAADSAALAAAAQLAPALATQTPEDAARAEAEANGAHLVSCDCAPGTPDATVEVTVTPHLAYVTPWFGRPAHARATAHLDADVLTYRSG